MHATVHPMSGKPISDGTVSFKDGRIVEVGAGLAPLADAEVIDAEGLHLYPGMIALNTALGLTEISSVAGSVDIRETGDVNPNVNTSIAVNPDSELIPVTRANGLTHVVSVPGGGLVSGSSALIRLGDEGYPCTGLAGKVRELVDTFGANRVMFGSDFPYALHGAPMKPGLPASGPACN